MVNHWQTVNNVYCFPDNAGILFLSEGGRLWLIIVGVEIAILANESMIKFKLVRSFLADPIGLSGEAFDANIGRESVAFDEEFESMGFCHGNKVIE